jgi:hypothetical protein
MEEVKVPFAIAKIGQTIGQLMLRDFAVVALEAHFVFLFGVGSVELRRKIFAQDSAVITAMWIVAGAAIALLHGTVAEGLVSDISAEFVMTLETEIRRRNSKQLWIFRAVHVVTLAAVAVGDWTVRGTDVYIIREVVVASDAKLRRIMRQEIARNVGMWAVTIDASLRDRLMRVALVLVSARIDMALDTEIICWRQEIGFELAGMRVVAGKALAVRDRRMNERFHEFSRIMTTEAEIRTGGLQAVAIGAPVRVVAANTISVFNRRVDVFAQHHVAIRVMAAKA